MAIKTLTLSPTQVKRQAKGLVQSAKESGEVITHQTALDLVAQEQGVVEGWHAYKLAWKNRLR